MKRSVLIVLGVLLFMVSLWGGSYGMHYYGIQSWQGFPLFMTAMLGGAVGVFLAVHGALD